MEQFVLIFSKTRFRILWHILFWLVVLVYYTAFFGHQNGYYWLTFKFISLLLPITIATTYVFNYYLIPKYLLENRFWLFALLAFYTLLFSFYLISLIIFPFLVLGTKSISMETLDKSILDVYFLVVGMYTVILIAILVKLLKFSYEKQTLNLQLLQEKTETELEMLRSQINPHFLFNTLNNIYTLSLKKSDQTPEVVLKLADMLDYLLYESNATKVPLSKEIKLIENYLYLQQIRFGNRLRINFKKDEHISNQQIAPMLLLPFVENSFKHGVGKHRDKAWIDIELTVSTDSIVFKVKNSQPEVEPNKKEHISGGIGIHNVQKRLDLIYRDNYILNIKNLDKTYSVNLKLSTTS